MKKDSARILLIDDEEGFCFFTKNNLELRGYEVLCATRPQEGLHLAKASIPDLILLDLCMPQMNGFELLKRLKEDGQTAGIPVCILTAQGDDDSRLKAVGLYNDDYLEKPIETEALIGRIEKVLSRFKKRSAA